MAKVVNREESDGRLQEIDGGIKNKFRWNWLERSVSITYRNQKSTIETSSFLLGKFIRKVDKPGLALCVTCDKLINYGSKGASALDEHCSKSKKHADKMSLQLTNVSMENFVPLKKSSDMTSAEPYGIHPDVAAAKTSACTSTLKPLVPMCDRISNSEVC